MYFHFPEKELFVKKLNEYINTPEFGAFSKNIASKKVSPEIMVVEDQPVDRKIIIRHIEYFEAEFKAIPCHIKTEQSCVQALADLSSSKDVVKLIFADLNLSDSREFDFFEAMTKMEINIPTVIVSGNDSPITRNSLSKYPFIKKFLSKKRRITQHDLVDLKKIYRKANLLK